MLVEIFADTEFQNLTGGFLNEVLNSFEQYLCQKYFLFLSRYGAEACSSSDQSQLKKSLNFELLNSIGKKPFQNQNHRINVQKLNLKYS